MEANDRVFALQAFLVYTGSGNNGHYEAYIMNSTDPAHQGCGIMKFSDAQCESAESLTKSVYQKVVMAIYELSTCSVGGVCAGGLSLIYI